MSRDRVIREVAGLRPYRAEGFVVRAERFGSKLLVHNYGHGGGGVTLSWGTADMAAELVIDSGPGGRCGSARGGGRRARDRPAAAAAGPHRDHPYP